MIGLVQDAQFGICPRCAQRVVWLNIKEREGSGWISFWRTTHSVFVNLTPTGKKRFTGCWYFQASAPSQTVAGSLVEVGP